MPCSLTGQAQKVKVKDMSKLPPIDGHTTLDDIIVRIFRLMVERSGGWISKDRDPREHKRIRLQAKMKNGEYTLNFFIVLEGDHYRVEEFSSVEKDSDQGAPYWMPANWAPRYSLKPGDWWIINKGSDLVALFEAHTKWSKLEGYYTVFEEKDKNI